MRGNKPVADKIQEKLEIFGLSGLAAALLEGLAPLGPLAAQLAYILQPMVNQSQATSLAELAGWLEQPEEVQAVAGRLGKDRP